MSKYKCLIFDVDNTILMYDKSAHVAIKIFLEGFKIVNRPDYEQLFVDVCNETWIDMNMNKLSDPYILNNYHELSKLHALKRFEVYSEHLKDTVLSKYSPDTLSTMYDDIFADTRIYENNALEVLTKCSKTHMLAAATNGLASMQKRRVQPFSHMLSHLFISEQMNCVKPMIEYYEYMLRTIGLDKSECLFIGDLYSTDILGALNAGIDACWYRTDDKKHGNMLEDDISGHDKNTPIINSLDKIFEYI